MRDFQTPQKDHSRSSDLMNRKSQLKKSQKIPKKSLNGLFTSVSDSITPLEHSDYSPVSQITEVSASSDVTPISKSVTESNDDVAVERFEFNNVEGDVVVNLLKHARTEVTNVAGVDLKSKKVLDALIELVIDEYNSCTGEKERCTEYVSEKARVAALCFAIWCVAVMGFLFFNTRLNNYSYSGPFPT